MTSAQKASGGAAQGLFARKNRGLLLDATVFLANVFLMWLITPMFFYVLERAGNEEPWALIVVFIALIAVFVLPPAAAILKRHSFHKRGGTEDGRLTGCLCNPIFYFCLQIVIICAINAFVMHYVLGLNDPGPEIFISSLLFLLVLAIVNTVFVFRYFTPPKSEPKNKFFLSRDADLLGDVFIFANVLIYQLIWNLLTMEGIFGRVSGVADFFGRLFFLTFIAFLLYFPPRIFYLAEDINRPGIWLTMFAANSPVIFRILFGGGTGFLFW